MPYTFVDNELLTAGKLNEHCVNDAPQWQGYAPTWTGVTALGNGATAGQWCRIGSGVYFRAQLAVGATTSFGAGNLFPSLPTPAPNPSLEMIPGMLFDSSPTNFQPCVFIPGAYILGPSGRVTTTAPWTWAAGDLIRVAGFYQPSS